MHTRFLQFITVVLTSAGLLGFSSLAAQHTTSPKAEGGAYNISATIEGSPDSLVLFIPDYSEDGRFQKADTLIAIGKNGRFGLKGDIDKPQFIQGQFGLSRRAPNFNLFLEKGQIKITGATGEYERLSVTGTPSNNDMTSVKRLSNAIYGRMRALTSQHSQVKEGSEESRRVMSEVQKKRDSIDKHEVEFIRTHPDSYVSGVLLYPKQDRLPINDLESLYSALHPMIKKMPLILNIPQKIAARKLVAVGQKAPDFTTTDTSGKQVRLSDYKGKYVLLEFWAHWCVPCRKQGPALIAAHQRFAEKGFDILQYSIDDKAAEQKWLQAIRDDKLAWTHVSDLGGFGSPVARLYGVQPIPDNFLIDPDGTIIGRRLDGDELLATLTKLLSDK